MPRVRSTGFVRMNKLLARREELKRSKSLSPEQSRRLLALAHRARKRMFPAETNEWIRSKKAEKGRRQVAEAAQARARELFRDFRERIEGARDYQSYKSLRNAFMHALQQEFKGEVYAKLRAWVYKNLLPLYGKPKQFHSGYFASESDAHDYIQKNKKLVWAALKRANILSYSWQSRIFDAILPQLVEYMMRFDPRRTDIGGYLFGHAKNLGMKQLQAENKGKREYSVPFEDTAVARPTEPETSRAPLGLPSWVKGRNRIILRETLNGRNAPEIAAILARETGTKPLSRERIRQILKDIRAQMARRQKKENE